MYPHWGGGGECSNVIAEVLNSHKVDTGRITSVSTQGINHIHVMSVVHNSHKAIV